MRKAVSKATVMTRLTDRDRDLGVTPFEIETRAVFRQGAVGKDGRG